MSTLNDRQTALAKYMDDLEQYPPLDAREERKLFRAHAAGDRTARDRIVRAHLRYVVKLAKRFVGHGVSLEDLLQEGNLGLLRALERFNRNRLSKRNGKRVRFIAYASYWVHSLLVMAVQEKGQTIKVDRNVQLKISKIRKVRKQLEAELGRAATDIEVARRAGFTSCAVRKMRAAENIRVTSLDQPVVGTAGERDETTLYMLLAAELPAIDDTCSDTLVAETRHQALAKVVEALDPRERKIVEERLFREADERQTHAQLAQQFGVSRNYVAKMENQLKYKIGRLVRNRANLVAG